MQDLPLHTPQNYNDAAKDAVLTNGQSIKSTRIKFNCHLNRSHVFHVALNLILDCMHDFLEGVVPFVIMFVLRNFSKTDRYNLSAKELNDRLNRFGYGFYDKKINRRQSLRIN